MATGNPRHTWTDNATPITAAKLNETEQDVADALATAIAAENGLTTRAPSSHSHNIGAADLTATGARSSSTFLRGDNVWAVPAVEEGGGGGGSSFVTPEDYGAIGTDSTDDQAALAAMFAALQPGDTVFLHPDRTYRHSGVLIINAPGSTVTGGGTLLATSEMTSAFSVEGDNITLENIALTCPSVTTGGPAGPQKKLLIYQCNGAVVRNVRIDGSANMGITIHGSHDYLIEDVVVENTTADGIHSTAGSTRGRIVNATVTNTGDDCISVVSYQNPGSFDFGMCSDIDILNCRVSTSWRARGLTVVGGERITLRNNRLDGTAGAGLYIASESSFETYGCTDVIVDGLAINEANTLNDPRPDHGAILLVADRGASYNLTRITLRDVVITNTDLAATRQAWLLLQNGSTANSILLERVTAIGPGPLTMWTSSDPAAVTLVDVKRAVGSRPATDSRAVRIYASGTGQTVASGALTAIDFNVTEYNDDPQLYVFTQTPDSIITATEPGRYLVLWSLRFSGGNIGERYINLTVNWGIRAAIGTSVGTTGADLRTGNTTVRLNANDFVAVTAYVDGGAAVNVDTGQTFLTTLELVRLGD